MWRVGELDLPKVMNYVEEELMSCLQACHESDLAKGVDSVQLTGLYGA